MAIVTKASQQYPNQQLRGKCGSHSSSDKSRLHVASQCVHSNPIQQCVPTAGRQVGGLWPANVCAAKPTAIREVDCIVCVARK
ncbi:hypothetical protein NPIL_375161 [Nephila pilipes]|uniref:Uncharacterized protein n=1 Tax=Nephila pilipes TaxID=299642 RepID=A0A8X6NXR9_NEPPI|nr:hypothetical protein NPIL_375161 [Nephila pilipes]